MNQSLYAHCTCARIEQREHTEALNRNAEALAAQRDDNPQMETLRMNLEDMRSSRDYWREDAARLRGELEKWNLSDETWRILEMETRPATDTVYGWTVQKWRDTRAALAQKGRS